MYCPSCGMNIPDASSVCPSCSAPITLGAYDDAVNRAFERHRKITKLSREAAAARKASNHAKEEHQRMAWRFKSCSAVTLVLTTAWMAFVMYPASTSVDWYGIYETSWAAYGIPEASVGLIMLGTLVLLFLLCATFIGSLVFGTPPVIDFIKRNGFGIWGSFFVLVAAGAILFIIAGIVGFPYFFHLMFKVSSTKKEANALEEKAVRLEHAAAAC